MIQYECLEDRCLIIPQKDEADKITDGGIVIPETVAQVIYKGLVFSIGEGRYATETGVFMPTILHAGDAVLYATEGVPMKVPDDTGTKVNMLLMRESDVLMRVSEKI